MLNLKKTAVAVLAFGSSAVFAGTMGPVCTPGSVTVPCPRTAWDFGAQALYLQPTSTDGVIGVVQNHAEQSESSLRRDPWSWGFQIEGSYHFNTGNDLNLNWYHLDASHNTVVALGGGQTFLEFIGDQRWGANSSVSINGSRKWDAVNLEFGQHIDLGEFTNLRLHGGVEYARINQSITLNGNLAGGNLHVLDPVTHDLSEHPAGTPQSITAHETYNGFGPRVGSDFGYGWNNGFAVYAKGAMAMLVGNTKADRVSATAVHGVGSSSYSATTVNPELEAKLGATYNYAMAQGDLGLDIGWMWVNYFNVGVGGHDFGLQGPYIGLKWVGNVA